MSVPKTSYDLHINISHQENIVKWTVRESVNKKGNSTKTSDRFLWNLFILKVVT